MISYHQLDSDLLATHRESYKKTLNALRPSGDISKEWLLKSFENMQKQWSKVFVALHTKDGLIGSQTLLIEQKMLRNGAKAWHLEDACVQVSYQWQGIWKKLLELVIKEAENVWCYKIIADTREELVPWFEKYWFDSPERMIRKYL